MSKRQIIFYSNVKTLKEIVIGLWGLIIVSFTSVAQVPYYYASNSTFETGGIDPHEIINGQFDKHGNLWLVVTDGIYLKPMYGSKPLHLIKRVISRSSNIQIVRSKYSDVWIFLADKNGLFHCCNGKVGQNRNTTGFVYQKNNDFR